ncbi:MAG: T9SS type A sorting domain-containing protein [Bacteroidales bacterium]|nr:T9SS type A sorting domain-containing protein [Bacteroidales bacterium]
MMFKKYLLIIFAISWSFTAVLAQQLSQEELKNARWLSQDEYDHKSEVGKFFQPTDAPVGLVFPVAEFEPMQGALIAYPFGIPMELIVEMSEVVMVTTIVSSSSQANSVTNMYESAGVNMDKVDFLIEPHDTYWTRDYGPWFIREEDKVSIINFTYNRPRPDDDIMPVNVANMIGADYYNMPVIHTGGNYMCDGFGIAAQTELVYQENTISNNQVDQYMEDYLGVTENYVINDPLDDYIMHIDCWGKFLDSDKVLIAEVPESDYRYEDYEAAAAYFATRNCAYGYPWEVIRVYAPGDYPYTPYTNALILNNKVFLPITGSMHDDAAIATWEEAMPGYEIIPIMDGSYDWINSDALHCRVHEIADIAMLKITHIPPYHGEVEYLSEFIIEAQIHAYSNEALYPDSLLLYYKINEGAYISIVMDDQGDEQFMGNISANPGDEISYYIHAADESGRSENSPYIGAADPFVFTVLGENASYLAVSPDTLFYWDYDPRIVIENIGTSSIEIEDLRKGAGANEIWEIDYTVPEISSFPYLIASGDSIEVFISFAIGCRELWYDSLLVQTADSIYFGILANDVTQVNEAGFYSLEINLFPNPITEQGGVKFDLQEASAVELSIYNIQGQLVQVLENSRLSSGMHQYIWNGQNIDGQEAKKGVYFIQLQIGDQLITKKWLKM